MPPGSFCFAMTPSRVYSPLRMTLPLIVLAALGLGLAIPSRRVLFAPALIGLVALGALTMAGQDVTDTPIPFLVIVSTVFMGIGHVARTHAFRQVPPPRSSN